MTSPVDALLWAFLLGGWTFMWLVWSFESDVRAWLVALFPARWRAGTSRAALASMSPMSLERWLVASDVPPAMCQLLSCRKCFSAHVAASGALVLLLAGVLQISAALLVWAAGAGIGNLIYEHYQRTNKN